MGGLVGAAVPESSCAIGTAAGPSTPSCGARATTPVPVDAIDLVVKDN